MGEIQEKVGKTRLLKALEQQNQQGKGRGARDTDSNQFLVSAMVPKGGPENGLVDT